MSAALLIDFGSTFTKLRAVDLTAGAVIAGAQAPSTVATDISEGLTRALDTLDAAAGGLPDFSHRLACSSAAGGLSMVTVGLVRELTAEAARLAALGAGAKLTGTFAYGLAAADVAAIEALKPDIVLLAGGTDGGNADVIEANARLLAESALACPIVVAGNRLAADRVGAVLADAGKPLTVTENVMPEFGQLNVEPARAAIRQVFIERIVHAKGIDKAAGMVDAVLMPTPAAVLDGARLLAEGAGGEKGFGPLLVVDVGGATTDVHSIASGAPTGEGVVPHGLPEPYVKRTVEGDLGMRINAAAIADAIGIEIIAAAAGLDRDRAEAHIAALAADTDRLPETDGDRRLDGALAEAAVGLAVRRHAGNLSIVQTVSGPVTMQTGKDLSAVKAMIGTGGVLASGAAPGQVLAAGLADAAEPHSLRPKRPEMLLDRDYILYACGLLAEVAPATALTLGRRHLHPLGLDAKEA